MKYHIGLRTHILFFGISAICLITGIFLIIYGTISLRDANDKLRTIDSYAPLNAIHNKNDHSLSKKNDLFQKSDIIYDQNLTPITNYLMTLVLVDVNYYSDYNSMASNAFNILKNSLTGSNTPARLQVISFNQYQQPNTFISGKVDVYVLVDLTYLNNPPSLQDISNVLQQNSIDILNSINMPQSYYPSQNTNQNCGCFGGQACPRIPTTTTTTTTQSPPPCTPGDVKCSTIIGIDTSSDVLTPDLYQKMIVVIEQNITTQIKNFTNVGLLSWDDKIRNYHGIGSINSPTLFDTILTSFKTYPGSNLKALLQFYVSLLGNTNNELSFVTFISKKPTIDFDVINYANQIMVKAKLNFIIIGDALKPSDLQGITSSQPFEYEFGECNTDGLVGSFNIYTECKNNCSPPIISTTTPSPTTTTAQCTPMTVTCNPNLIFAIDSSSDKLELKYFDKEMSYLQYNLPSLLANYDYSRVSLTSYSNNVLLQYPFGKISNYAEYLLDLQSILNQRQSSGSSLTNLMTNLNNLHQTNSDPISTYIFLSELDDNDMMNAIEQAKILKNKGQLYFIILGTAVHKDRLDPLKPTNVIDWLISDCGEKNLTDFIHSGFICQTNCGTTTPPPQPPTTTPQPPTTTTCSEVTKVCYSNVRIYVDSSDDILYSTLFKQEQSLLMNNLTNIIPHYYDQLAVLSQNKFFTQQEYGFGSIDGSQRFSNIINQLQQGPGYMLSEILNSLYQTIPKNNYPTTTFVFLSDKTKIDLQNSYQLAKNLNSNNNALYFILLGTAIKVEDVAPLMAKNTTIWQFSDCGEQLVLNFFNDNFICSYECGTTTTTTTTTTPKPTPCVEGPLQCNVVIGMDTSYDILIPTLYQSTLDVIQQNISQQITDFSKIALVAYDYDIHEFHDFGSIQDRNQFNNIVGNYQQHVGSNLKALLQFLDSIPVNGPTNYVVFISENQAFDYEVYQLAHNLKSKGKLQFIILGTDINPSELSLLSSTEAFYYNFGDCNIPDLINTFRGYLDCSVICSSTTTPQPPTTTTCSEVTKVCYSNVRIYVDSSDDILYSTLFKQEQSLLMNNLTNIIPHYYDQLAVLSQNKFFTQQEYGFGSIGSSQQFSNIINQLQQGPGYMLSEILSSLYQTTPNNNYPTTTFVFLSDKTKIDLSNSYQSAHNLNSNNNALYFILLGTAIKVEDVAPLMAKNTTIWQFSDCGEQLVLNFFNDNFICSYDCGTTTTTTTTTTPKPVPCVDGPTQCNVVIGMDTSYDILIPTLYHSTLDVIQQNISQQITDFSKIALVAYDYDIHEFHDFGSIQDQNQFNNIVGNYQQHVGTNLKALLKFLDSLPNYGHMNYVIFISEKQAFDYEVYQLSYNLKNKGKLQFIILGTDVNPSELARLGTSDAFYYNFGDCNIPDLINTFRGYLDCNVICSTTPPPPTVPPTTTCRPSTSPCYPNMMFAFDSSSDVLDDHYFENEKFFFLYNISSFIQGSSYYQNHYDQIALIPYNSIVSTSFTFGKILDNNMYINDVNTIQQGSGSGLANLLNVLDQQVPLNNGPISTYVFLSTVSSVDVQNAVQSSRNLLNKGSLSFIIIGTSVNIHQLDPLYKTNVTVWLGADCEIQDIINFTNHSLICNDYCPTPTPSLPPPSTTTPCPPSQMVCDPNLIVSVDVSSDSLPQSLFYRELSFLNNNNFTSIIKNYQRVDLAYYSSQSVNFKTFGTIQNSKEWYQDLTYINNTIQQSGGSDLTLLLSTLSTYLEIPNTPSDNKPVSTYIFISNNDTINDYTKQYAKYLESRGSLNFIILGTKVKPEYLQQLVPLANIYQWEVTSCTIDEVLAFITRTLTCYCTTTTTTSTTTTVTPTTTTTTTPQPYICDVIFSIDSSSDTLSKDEFDYEKSIIINNIPNVIKDFSRVAISTYDSSFINTKNFGSIKNSNDFIDFINKTTQNPGTDLTSELTNLNLLPFTGSKKVPIFIFIGTKNPQDLQNAVGAIQKLSTHADIYFIIVGTYVKRSDLTSLVPLNNIYVWDFSNCPISQLMNFIGKYGSCDLSIPTTQQPLPNVKPSPYTPCKSSLVFAIPTSEDMLSDDLYQNELNLFTNNYLIDEDFNHFERIGLVTYSEVPEVVIQFNQTTNLDDFNLKVTSGIQKNRMKGNNFVNLMEQLTNDYFFNYNYGLTKNYFIFIVNITANDINNAIPYANIINNQNGNLNFIILDTTNPSILEPLNPKNILTWSNDNEDVVSDFLINYIYCTKKMRRSLTNDH